MDSCFKRKNMLFPANVAVEYSVNISGIPKEDLLAELCNRATPQELGILQYVPRKMSPEDALQIIEARKNGTITFVNGRMIFEKPDELVETLSFDFVNGCPIHIDMGGDVVCSKQYDEIHGKGSVEAVVRKLRRKYKKPLIF